MAEKSKILVIGATGYIGKFLVEAAAGQGHQTFALVRENAVQSLSKEKLIESFKASGVTIIYVRTVDILRFNGVCMYASS